MVKKRKKSVLKHSAKLDLSSTFPSNAQRFTPPRFRTFFLSLFAVQALLLLWALGNHFIPNAAWLSLGFKINIVLCLLSNIFFIYSAWLNPHALDGTHSTLKKWFGLLFAPVLIYFLGYFSVIYGAGDLMTHFKNQPAMMQDVFEKKYVETRKGCKTRLNGESLKNGLPKHFCATPEIFEKLPPRVAVNIHGLQSAFGFDLQTIEFDWFKTARLPALDEH